MPNCLLTRISAFLILSMQQLLLGTQAARKTYHQTIKLLQDQAVQFLAGIKGRDGVEDAKIRLGLILLHKKRRDQWLRLLMRILAKKEHHSSLSESYNEIMKQPATTDNEITDTWDPSYLPN